MANLLVLNANGDPVTIKSTNTASVETIHHNAQMMVQNSHVSSLNPVPVSFVTASGGANVAITTTNPAPVGLSHANALVSNTNPLPTTLSHANVLVSNTNPMPVTLSHANVILSNTNSLPVSLCVANAVVSNTNAVTVQQTYPAWTTVWGVSAAPFTSTDQHSAAASVTDAPVSGKKIVVDEVHLSVDVPMSVTLKCETSGAVIAGPYFMQGNTNLVLEPGKNNKGWKLATADKKLQVITSAAGNVMVYAAYHSET